MTESELQLEEVGRYHFGVSDTKKCWFGRGGLLVTKTKKELHVWDPQASVPDQPVLERKRKDVSKLVHSPSSGLYIACSIFKKQLYLLDDDSLKLEAKLPGHTSHVYDVATCTQKPHLVASCSSDRRVRVWDLTSRKKVFEGRYPDPNANNPKQPLNCVAMSADGRLVATSGQKSHGYDITVMLWDLEADELLMSVPADRGQNNEAVAVTDGEVVVAGDELYGPVQVRAYDFCGEQTECVDLAVRPKALSPDGRFLLTGGLGRDVREVRDWRTGASFSFGEQALEAADFSSDSKRLLGMRNGVLIVWKLPA